MADVLPVSVTVILPTRNEEEALGPTIDAIPRDWCESLEIMIVDGNSSDRTREIALEKGYISKEKLLTIANIMKNNQYGKYLLNLYL